MADIRINALANTASSTASDDYLAVDGTTNGTRKLSAYSPTFGGNLTVSGTGTSSVAGYLGIGTASPVSPFNVKLTGATGATKTKVSDFGADAIVQLSNNVASTNSEVGFFGTSGLPLGQIAAGFGFLREAAGTWGTAIKFYTHSASTSVLDEINECMRINSAGNLLIGTTTDGGQKLQVSGTAAISGGIVGTTTNDSAAAGIVGEYVSSTVNSGSAVSLTTGVAANITSISLTAGDWDVSSAAHFNNVPTGGSATVVSISTTSATHSTTVGSYVETPQMQSSSIGLVIVTPTLRISVSSTTTIYLVASQSFTGGASGTYGIIRARRVR